MVKKGILSFPVGVKKLDSLAKPLKGLRKRGRPCTSDVGRPPKIPKQSRFAKGGESSSAD